MMLGCCYRCFNETPAGAKDMDAEDVEAGAAAAAAAAAAEDEVDEEAGEGGDSGEFIERGFSGGGYGDVTVTGANAGLTEYGGGGDDHHAAGFGSNYGNGAKDSDKAIKRKWSESKDLFDDRSLQ